MVANATHEPPGEGRQIKMKDKQSVKEPQAIKARGANLKALFQEKKQTFNLMLYISTL